MKGYKSKEMFKPELETAIKREASLQGVSMRNLAYVLGTKSTGTVSAAMNLTGSPSNVRKICERLDINPNDYLNDGYDV